MDAFKETYNMFTSAIEDSMDIESWWGWMTVPDGFKAAALYVRFYSQITLAWKKYQKPWIEDELAVSTVLQYIVKNVPIISESKGKFTEAYMYTIAKNAIYPLGKIKCHYQDWALRTSWCVMQEIPDEVDYDNLYYIDNSTLHKVYDDSDVLDIIFASDFSDMVQSVLTTLDDVELQVVEFLIGGKRPRKSIMKRFDQIMVELKNKFSRIASEVGYE